MTTKPKRNADFRFKRKGLCIFIKSLNLWDLALDKKNKTKQKALASCADGNEKFPYYRTTLSSAVVSHLRATLLKIKQHRIITILNCLNN
jgi:hypothetical protein